MIPDTDSVSWLIALISARDCCVRAAISWRVFPTFRVIHTNTGVRKRDSTVSCQDRISIAMSVLIRITTFERLEDAVSVITDSIPPTSLDRRDWISPVRVPVKNRSGIRWRCRYRALRKSCITR